MSKQIKLAVKTNDGLFTATLPESASIDDVMIAMKGMILSAGYQNGSYEQWVLQEASDINADKE